MFINFCPNCSEQFVIKLQSSKSAHVVVVVVVVVVEINKMSSRQTENADISQTSPRTKSHCVCMPDINYKLSKTRSSADVDKPARRVYSLRGQPRSPNTVPL